MAKHIFMGACLLLACLHTYTADGQVALPPAAAPAPITAIEYFLESDPGVGMATPIASAGGTEVLASAAPSLSGLTPGIRRIYLRARDAAGNWGLTNMHLFYYAPNFSFSIPASTDITALEYFFDTDPGFGLAHSLPILNGTEVTLDAGINLSGLSSGMHRLGIRGKNAAGNWGLTSFIPIYIIPAATLPAHAPATDVVRAEYFINTDPGFGNGISLPVSGGTDYTLPAYAVNLSGLPEGVHHFSVRLQDAAGNWSLSNQHWFSLITAIIQIPPAQGAREFSMLEYFFNEDPGMGNGALLPLPLPPTTDLNSYHFAADVSSLPDGAHTLFIRTVGEWSLTSARSFTIGIPLPVRLMNFSARKENESVLLNWETGNEQDNLGFIVERSANAIVFDSLGFLPATPQSAGGGTYFFRDKNPLAGKSYYRLKQMDQSGEVTYSKVIAIEYHTNAAFTIKTNNPVQGKLKIFTKASWLDAPITIYNMQGQAVLHLKGQGQAVQQFDVHMLTPGYYTITAIVQGNLLRARFLKD